MPPLIPMTPGLFGMPPRARSRSRSERAAGADAAVPSERRVPVTPIAQAHFNRNNNIHTHDLVDTQRHRGHVRVCFERNGEPGDQPHHRGVSLVMHEHDAKQWRVNIDQLNTGMNATMTFDYIVSKRP